MLVSFHSCKQEEEADNLSTSIAIAAVVRSSVHFIDLHQEDLSASVAISAVLHSQLHNLAAVVPFSIMTASKWTGTKRAAAVCLRERKPYQLPTVERQVKAARLLRSSKVEDVRAKLESIQGIADLDHDVESMIVGLHKQIHALRSSKEISNKEAYKFDKQLTKLQDRYIDSCSFGNDL